MLPSLNQSAAPTVEVNPLDLQRALSDECQEVLGMTLEAAKKIWAYDPQLLIGRSWTSIPLERKNFINRLKDLSVFPCNTVVEKLSPAGCQLTGCQLIVSWFPID